MGSDQRTAIVTGAFGTLGSEVARTLARHGFTVALVSLEASAPATIESEFGAPHLVVPGVDTADASAAAAAFAAVAAQLGGIDALVNVAGGFAWQKVADGDPATWDRMFTMNLKTAVVATRSALPHIRRGGTGRIVNISAGAALNAAGGMGAYAASKAGVLRLTESLADELRDENITVNAILRTAATCRTATAPGGWNRRRSPTSSHFSCRPLRAP
jgi:NAD(P)-dependent dehydrogenase (short-subunit alcohol dehydrogenase family)